MATKCEHCPLRRKELFAPMSKGDIEFMEKFKVGEMVVDPNTPILLEGSNTPQLYTALYGMGLRYKILKNGNRQVINFIFPGDFIGLQASLLGEMGHSVEATTSMTLCVFDRTEFWSFSKTNPERAFDLTWLAAAEEHFLGDTLATVGQRTALEAVAWALTRLFQRGTALGLVQNRSMRMPFRQQDLADALGLSLVHTNKTLAQIRKRQLASWANGDLQVSDIQALAKVAAMDLEAPKIRPIM